MKRSHQHLKTILSLCLGLSLLALPGFAADIAYVQMGSDGIQWQPATDAASWVLTVTGPDGFQVRQEFDSAPALGLFTADGQFLADGLYKYELQAIPHIGPQLRQELDAAAGDLDLRERLAPRVQGLGGVQSGHFRIYQGALVQDDHVELPAPGGGVTVPTGDLAVSQAVPEGSLDHTQVISMDLVVQGSICVGFDCPNSPSFGADTLRLQENNLRIHFDDTSNSASFPNNDWRLIANDSTNGGANKFVIQDATAGREVFTIEAGTISNALYVDSAGDVGIGTSSPVVEVHAVDGNTPTLRLEQNGSNGFTPQTWDVAGNETNFFVRDVSNGSKLPFRIRPGAPDSSIDIAADGDVGLGTASPQQRLHITDTSNSDGAKIFLQSGTDNTVGHLIGVRSDFFNEDLQIESLRNLTVIIDDNNDDANANFLVSVNGSPDTDIFRVREDNRVRMNGASVNATSHPLVVGTDSTNGNGAHLTAAGVWTNGSSRLNKMNIVSLEATAALAALQDLRPVRYRGKQQPDEEYVGFIAEEVPDLVAMNDRKGIASMDVVGVLTRVVQEQQKTIDALQQRLEKLEQEGSSTP